MGRPGPYRLLIGVWLAVTLIFSAMLVLHRVGLPMTLYAVALATLPLGLGLWRLREGSRRQLTALTARDATRLHAFFPAAQAKELENILLDRAKALQGQRDIQRCLNDDFSLWVHQVKTPLSAATLLAREADRPSLALLNALEAMRAYVDMALVQVVLSDQEAPLDLAPCQLEDILKEALQRTAGLFLAGKVQVTLEPLPLAVQSDARLLAVLFEQVLSNAAKYTPKGRVAVYSKGAAIYIQDTGMGIAADELPRIFQRGYAGSRGRLDERASGMGLYVAQRIADRLDLKLDIRSDLGVGTTVQVTFPAYSLIRE